MDQRDQEKDMGLPNSLGYNHQESSSYPAPKLPSLQDRRRRNEQIDLGNTILSPNQTLDHQHLFQQPVPQIPEAANTQNSSPDPVRQQPTTSIRYRECLKNHAASTGGHVLDGCGEFMPNGEEGTTDYLKCAACDCHRNFHRRETDEESQTPGTRRSNVNNHHNHNQPPPTHPAQQHHLKYSHSFSRSTHMPPVMMNFGGNRTGFPAESSSEDLNMFQMNAGGQGGITPSSNYSKKRFRTKFSHEQKERMQEFAEKLGWRIQKQDEQEVHQFCNEVGVKRQVFKVWMHNSKQAIKRKQP